MTSYDILIVDTTRVYKNVGTYEIITPVDPDFGKTARDLALARYEIIN